MAGDCLKELARVEKLLPSRSRLGGGNRKSPTPSIANSLDVLLNSLREFKHGIEAGATSVDAVGAIPRAVEDRKKEIDDRQKEVYNGLSKLGKALDKRFPAALPEWPDMFTAETSAAAIDRTVALHLIRTGQFSTAATFVEESRVRLPEDVRTKFETMHAILDALRRQDLGPALEWAVTNREFLASRNSDLEFALHRSQYMRILSSTPPDRLRAVAYASEHLQTPDMQRKHELEVRRLVTAMLFLPTLDKSPYKDLAEPSIHSDLEGKLAREYCAKLGMSRQLPLMVIADIATGGAVSRIEKGRRVMQQNKSEWSATDELPIEIFVAPEHRYHSLFVCPVSKEQSTPQNPPMMMSCGHVVSKDSLGKLTKPGGRVKCPYCPMESKESAAIQVYF
ncbi:CTLH/CRA C-terminal to lish motif domain-containing protein [Auriculariales sp. MPI-PUGE-AT-0066]|nr:CTLH/CRA C-terminal to lish motif domain-containing protein [Auriculariales sp. MPI-PUGE-AT-0066]